MSHSGSIRLSIIIPTYRRPRTLARALRSLQDQTLRDVEIIVADNGVDPKLKDMLEDFNRTATLPARYVPEPQLGLHHARHAGVREARGASLAFTDDDATFGPKWSQAYVDAFDAYPAMLAAGGPVRPIWEVPPPEWLLSYMDSFETSPDGRPALGDAQAFNVLSLMERGPEFLLDHYGFFFGVNMAVRHEVFGWSGFRPELFGTRTIGNGETGLNLDIAARRGLIGYVPDALVYHHVPPHRLTVQYIRKWAWHLGGGDMYTRWWNRKRTLRSLVKEALIIGRNSWWQWLGDCFVRHRRDPAAIDTQFQASLGWCKLNYVWWMLTDSQVQAALDMRDFRP